jgi:hypothetical protein
MDKVQKSSNPNVLSSAGNSVTLNLGIMYIGRRGGGQPGISPPPESLENFKIEEDENIPNFNTKFKTIFVLVFLYSEYFSAIGKNVLNGFMVEL